MVIYVNELLYGYFKDVKITTREIGARRLLNPFLRQEVPKLTHNYVPKS